MAPSAVIAQGDHRLIDFISFDSHVWSVMFNDYYRF